MNDARTDVAVNPNDGLRFVLELVGIGALGYGGWAVGAGALRWLLALGLPLGAAALWATFRVPNDPGPAPVAVPGPARLVLEVVVFGAAVIALAVAGRPVLAGGFGLLVFGHYVLARRRVRLLLGR